MANKLSNLLGNTTKNTSNVDAISDKIAQSVVKILLSSNKIDALNLKEKKDLSGGRKIGNIDTARYTTISENQNTRMRKGDGVANVLSRLYGLLKGSHDEDVKQMELTRNFKEEKLKESRKYSKITHQTFGKKRRRSKTKTGLAGLAVLGLISSMGSIMDWMENFTAEGGVLDQMIESITDSWKSFKEESLAQVKELYNNITGRDLEKDIEGIRAEYDKLSDEVTELSKKVFSDENKSWIDEKALQWVNFLHNTYESLSTKLFAWAKLFHDVYLLMASDPAWVFKPGRWKELSGIVSDAMSGYITESDKSNLDFAKNTVVAVGGGVASATTAVGAAIKPVITDMGEHADKKRARIKEDKKNLGRDVGNLFSKVPASVSKMFDYAKEEWKNKDYNPLNIPGNAADWALGVGETLNKVSPNTGIATNIEKSLDGHSLYFSGPQDQNYKPPEFVPEKDKLKNPFVNVINNSSTSANPPTKPAGSSGPGVNATCRNDNKTLSKINMGCVVGP